MNPHHRIRLVRWGWVLATVGQFSGAFARADAFPIATNGAALQAVIGAASDGTNVLVGMLSSTNVRAQLVSRSGALLGPALNLGASVNPPLVAFGKSKYLVVWSDDLVPSGVNLLGQFVSSTGARLGSTFGLLPDPSLYGYLLPQAIASDGTNSLLVWSDDVNLLYGQIIGPAGNVLQSEIPLSGSPAGRAAAAFDGTNFLVAFQFQTNDSPEQWNTYGTFISPSGAAGIPFQISATPSASSDGRVAIAFGRTNYLVAWARDAGPGFPNPAVWDIYGRFVDASGNLAGDELTLVNSAGDERFPSLAFDDANQLLCWTEAFDTTNSNIRFRFFGTDGQATGSPFTIFIPHGSQFPSIGSVLFDGGNFAVVGTLGSPGSQSADVYGAFVPGSATPPRLEALRPPANELFRLRLSGTPGISYAIQWTTNIITTCYFCVTDPCPCITRGINWVPIFTTNAPSGSFEVIDPESNLYFYRVYRAVAQ